MSGEGQSKLKLSGIGNECKPLLAGTTECFKMVKEFLDGVGHKYDLVAGAYTRPLFSST